MKAPAPWSAQAQLEPSKAGAKLPHSIVHCVARSLSTSRSHDQGNTRVGVSTSGACPSRSGADAGSRLFSAKTSRLTPARLWGEAPGPRRSERVNQTHAFCKASLVPGGEGATAKGTTTPIEARPPATLDSGPLFWGGGRGGIGEMRRD